MRWCSGYLDDDELEHQLKVWKGWLYKSHDGPSEGKVISAIILLDNVTEEGKLEYRQKEVYPGQRIRQREKLERIFKKAHLRYDMCSQ